MTDPAKPILVEKWIRKDIQQLSAYHVPDPGKMIKLDAMENPYTWPGSMRKSWLSVLDRAPVNRYPDPSAAKLVQQLKQAMDVPEDMAVILGNGSDELIQIICMALSQPGRVVMAPDPTFVMYQMIAQFTQMEYVGIPLDEQFQLDMPAILKAIKQHQPAVIFLAYPNNPTGNLFSESDIKSIIEASPGLVVVDEAYHAFAEQSFMPQLPDYDNLLVMRTVSKMGLAGLRLGLLCGPEKWISQFDKVRLPYNINVLTQITAEFALQHIDVLNTQTQQICRDREQLKSSLDAIDGLNQYHSAANFILFKASEIDSETLFNALKEEGVLIKRFGADAGALANCLRVTVGTEQENKSFVHALKKVLSRI